MISNPKKTNSVHIRHRGIREDSSKKQKIEDIPLTKAKKKRKRGFKKKKKFLTLPVCEFVINTIFHRFDSSSV